MVCGQALPNPVIPTSNFNSESVTVSVSKFSFNLLVVYPRNRIYFK
jgi:hypothetical protein